jgi:hypothetical protein
LGDESKINPSTRRIPMLPPPGIRADLWSLARASCVLISNPETPKVLKKCLLKMLRKLKKKLPPEARLEIYAAEAEAAIKASYYFRRSDKPSAD